MTDSHHAPDRDALARLVAQSLHAADALGLAAVGIALNDALVQLTGDGVAPPR